MNKGSMEKDSGKKIAILGATSHISKGLIHNFGLEGRNTLFLFARSLDRVREFLKEIGREDNVYVRGFSELDQESYDVLINCVGVGNPVKLQGSLSQIFALTETFDNLILEYLTKHPDALYINFSSGAAYGTDFTSPVKESTHAKWDINHIKNTEYYGVVKLYCETKHRALKELQIVDLRVFGYFSRYIDLSSKYLLTEILSSIMQESVFETTNNNIVRDYIHPEDLISLIQICISKKALNDVFDVYSIKPVTKFELLDYFGQEYGLNYTISNTISIINVTGNKMNYYSTNRKAETIGYAPRYTSLEAVIQESKIILNSLKPINIK